MQVQFNCQKYFYFKLFRCFGWFGGFYGISTFVGYLTPNPFLCESVLFKRIQLSISTVCQTFPFQTIQAVICKNSVYCKYSFNVKNSSISNNLVKHYHVF